MSDMGLTRRSLTLPIFPYGMPIDDSEISDQADVRNGNDIG
jgi:hypothetical protein